jgi:hypothetical protein
LSPMTSKAASARLGTMGHPRASGIRAISPRGTHI